MHLMTPLGRAIEKVIGTLLLSLLMVSFLAGQVVIYPRAVGIGTETPLGAIHIQGSGGIDDDMILESIPVSYGRASVSLAKALGTFQSPQTIDTWQRIGLLEFLGYSGNFPTGGILQSEELVSIEVSGKLTDEDQEILQGQIDFGVADGDSLSTVMVLDSNHNIGIGTTAPLYNLDIHCQEIAPWHTGAPSYSGGLNLRSGVTSKDWTWFPLRTLTQEDFLFLSYDNNSIGFFDKDGLWTPSDRALKRSRKNIKTSELIRLGQLSPKKYYMTNDVQKDDPSVGFLAQELASIYPELVDQPGRDDQHLTINYQGIIPFMIKMFQELATEHEKLATEVVRLRKKYRHLVKSKNAP